MVVVVAAWRSAMGNAEPAAAAAAAAAAVAADAAAYNGRCRCRCRGSERRRREHGEDRAGVVHTAGMKGNGLKEPPLRQLRGRGARRAPWETLSLQLPLPLPPVHSQTQTQMRTGHMNRRSEISKVTDFWFALGPRLPLPLGLGGFKQQNRMCSCPYSCLFLHF